MACEAAHGKDITGLAAEKLKTGAENGRAGYLGHVQQTQAPNRVVNIPGRNGLK